MSAAAARRIGGSAHGRRPVFGPPCTVRCWSSFKTPIRSTDRARPSTARAYLQKRGSATEPEHDGSGKAEHEAPPRRGRQRHVARLKADWNSLPRQPHAGCPPECGAGVRTGRRCRSRRRPDKLHADKGYDHRRCRSECRRAASHLGSPGAASRSANTWDPTAGSWSAPWRGWLASIAAPSATSGAPTSASPSRRSPALICRTRAKRLFPDSKCLPRS